MKRWNAVGEVDVTGKRILIRGDFDVDDGGNPRVKSVIEIVKYVLAKGASKVRVIGHRETNYPICEDLRKLFPNVEFDDTLRTDPGEKGNDLGYAKKLAQGFDVYINEAFATSHRAHASIVSVPKVIKDAGGDVAIGLRFEKEIDMLSRVFSQNSSPSANGISSLIKEEKRVLVIGGVKIEDKQKFAEEMKDRFSAVLKGGKLPGVVTRPDGLDLAEEVIAEYEKIISEADMILAAGVMGKYEDPAAAEGTKRILEAIANNTTAYKVAGGGDIEMAISTYNLTDKFDWISVGGGAMLQYLLKGTLSGIEAIEKN